MAWMPATVETPTAILASARTPTAKEVRETIWTPAAHEFMGTLLKNSSERREIY
jgi:hypothetical protein